MVLTLFEFLSRVTALGRALGAIRGRSPKIDDDRHSGLGSWSNEDVVEYLKTGRNAHSGAAWLMAEVVANST
jgi:hypothetical protein